MQRTQRTHGQLDTQKIRARSEWEGRRGDRDEQKRISNFGRTDAAERSWAWDSDQQGDVYIGMPSRLRRTLAARAVVWHIAKRSVGRHDRIRTLLGLIGLTAHVTIGLLLEERGVAGVLIR